MNIVILDACRNNKFSRSFRSQTNPGLAPMKAPTGSLIIFATTEAMAETACSPDNC